jgi:hypothetical protein
VAEPRATIPPPHATLPKPLPNHDGGAQRSTNTRPDHRRRNHSPAWLLAQRSAQRRRNGAQATGAVAEVRSDNVLWWVEPRRRVSGTGGGGERSELSTHHTAFADQRNEKRTPPEADVRGTSAEAEQRAPQSERLPQPKRRSPEWNGVGAKRFAGPFVTLRRSRTQDAARVEQLRGHTAKTPPNLLDPDESIFELFAAVCRRRCPSGRRPQASQRSPDFRNAPRCDIFIGESRDEFRRRLALAQRSGASLPRHRESAPR